MSALTKNGVGAGGGPDDNAAQAGHLITHALTSEGHDASEDGTGRGTPLVPFNVTPRGRREGGAWSRFADTDLSLTRVDEARTLDQRGSGLRLAGAAGVRRLTPVECERLQGFPDGWTDIPWAGKPHAPDSRRYAALGDAVTVPVAEWIGRRLLAMTTERPRAGEAAGAMAAPTQGGPA